MPDDVRRQLLDEIVDELLAGARTEEEIVGPVLFASVGLPIGRQPVAPPGVRQLAELRPG